MTLEWTRAVVLSLTEFEVCWERLGLGETPWQLDPPRSGSTAPERQAIVDAAMVDLRRRGLGDGSGPRTDIGEQLLALAYPERSVDIRFRADTLVAGVAACRGALCALAVRQGREIAMLALRPDEAHSALLELIGAITPGHGREVRLPADVLDAASAVAPELDDRFADELVRRGVARIDAATVVEACRGAGLRGQLGASARRGDGTRSRRAPYVIGFHHTRTGHYRQIRHRNDVTIGPTNRRTMLNDMAELADSIR